MLSEKEIKRYARHLILPEVGEAGQQKLKDAKVLVIGAGGLGCPVLQYLTAAGVGLIGIVDPDKIDESNLQRQILYGTEDIGKFKVEIAVEKLSKQNPHVEFNPYIIYLDRDNALEIISGYDIVVDGSDNFATRYLVNDACVILNKILVFGSIFKFQGQVSVFNFQNGPTYRCLYPQPPEEGEMPNCAEIGVIGVLPGIVGALEANEVVKLITGIGEVVSGRLLSFDALSMQFDSFSFTVDPSNREIKQLGHYDTFCEAMQEITAEELKRKIQAQQDFQLVDVREEKEYCVNNIGGILMPLSVLEDRLSEISREKETVVHCASGARSKKAVNILKEKGFKKVYNLKNGLLDF